MCRGNRNWNRLQRRWATKDCHNPYRFPGSTAEISAQSLKLARTVPLARGDRSAQPVLLESVINGLSASTSFRTNENRSQRHFTYDGLVGHRSTAWPAGLEEAADHFRKSHAKRLKTG